MLRREKSTENDRRRRALAAWFKNRGARDTWQWLFRASKGRAANPPPRLKCDPRYGIVLRTLCKLCDLLPGLRTAWTKGVNAVALASHAGEVRLLEYDLKVDNVERTDRKGRKVLEIKDLAKGAKVRGEKRLTYGRRSNPWRQLQELNLTTFLREEYEQSPVLELDARYLGDEQAPLVRIAEQTDQPAALADTISFVAYILRLMISVHVWSFRRPDAAKPREPQRLPGIISGGWFRRRRAPEITELEVDQRPDGTPVRLRLTHYRAPRRLLNLIPLLRRSKLPVVMIHGYSASGTTFAHDAVRPNLAAYFLARHRDVWILDLRTSSGMPTARMPWRFEDAALVDIPAALAHIHRETRGKLDVIAHCMGSAMFSMAVLSPPAAGVPFSRERQQLPGWINRAVLSQIGPTVEFSPANVLRGYVLELHPKPAADRTVRVSHRPGSVTHRPVHRPAARDVARIPKKSSISRTRVGGSVGGPHHGSARGTAWTRCMRRTSSWSTSRAEC